MTDVLAPAPAAVDPVPARTTVARVPAADGPERSGGGRRASLVPFEFSLSLTVNGARHDLIVDGRTTLLDLLRERLRLTGAKVGCNQGTCGACTIHVDGQRTLACLMLAVMAAGKAVTTIEGVAGDDGGLHPMQSAFLEHDALQCGYCTPGQIMSAIACVREGHAGTDDEVREFMSGNLCRCAAYPNIVAAVRAGAGPTLDLDARSAAPAA